jgi:nucleoside 2-deoxyribosyltransferase
VETRDAPKVYIAGPLGFSESGRQYHETAVLPALRSAGFEPLDPWDIDDRLRAVLELPLGNPARATDLPAVNREIGRRNAALIQRAAGLLAFLDGPDVDSGTAAEIGYAAALARPIVGIRTDTRVSGDNEATTVNLQVEWFVVESGGTLTRDLGEAVAKLHDLLSARAH